MAEPELPSETFDASDKAAIDNATRDEARRQREDADVLRKLMHDKPGRAFVYRFLESCHIYGETFAPGSADITAFRLGEENIGKKLMLSLQAASVDLYMQMIREAQSEVRRTQEVRRTERKNREKETDGVSGPDLTPSLPPPAGFPGGPPLKRTKKK